jgi:hypothetical protein
MDQILLSIRNCEDLQTTNITEARVDDMKVVQFAIIIPLMCELTNSIISL